MKFTGEMIRIARLTIPTIKAAVFMVEIFSINAKCFEFFCGFNRLYAVRISDSEEIL